MVDGLLRDLGTGAEAEGETGDGEGRDGGADGTGGALHGGPPGCVRTWGAERDPHTENSKGRVKRPLPLPLTPPPPSPRTPRPGALSVAPSTVVDMNGMGVRSTAGQVPAPVSDEVSRGAGSRLGAADGGPADLAAARRRAERRAARITSGARELEQRLTDLLRGGLAAAGRAGHGLWEETAARMVDAQAPGLAGRVRELGAIPGSGPGWPVRLLEECALTHLLDRAWLTADRLPAPFATTVRTRVGLPAPVVGSPVRDHWLVLAQYDTGDSRLTTRRVWLYGTTGGRTALVLSYGAAGRAPRLSLPVGALLDGELTPHAGSGQVRAEPGERFVPVAGPAAPPPGGPVGAALDAYGRALREDPWLDAWPVTLSGVVPARAEYGWQLADADGREALPLTSGARSHPGLWRLVALSGGAPVTVFGECGHRGFTPLAAWSPEAPNETVPLL
ncbi:SWIM zinc finger family protein [Streptomyces sp. NPDC056528]|uniref:SWIM zinc finger family protein n=1 Tax=Streptomyces sp. NPDC056528 TaxID=3345854 RepID=UPI003686D0BC